MYRINTGTTHCSNTPSGNWCSVSCNAGYTSTGSAKCYASNWIVKPTCEPSPCSSDPLISNLNYAQTHCENTGHGLTCVVECKTGYTRNSMYVLSLSLSLSVSLYMSIHISIHKIIDTQLASLVNGSTFLSVIRNLVLPIHLVSPT